MCIRSHIGSKFSKISLGQLCTGGTVVVHLYCSFSLCCQMVLQQSVKFRAAFFGQFCTSLRKNSVANYAQICMLFSPSIKGLDVLCKALKVSQLHRQVEPQESQIYVRNFPKCKKSAAELCQILSLLRQL